MLMRKKEREKLHIRIEPNQHFWLICKTIGLVMVPTQRNITQQESGILICEKITLEKLKPMILAVPQVTQFATLSEYLSTILHVGTCAYLQKDQSGSTFSYLLVNKYRSLSFTMSIQMFKFAPLLHLQQEQWLHMYKCELRFP